MLLRALSPLTPPQRVLTTVKTVTLSRLAASRIALKAPCKSRTALTVRRNFALSTVKMGREDLLNPTTAPHPPVRPLGHSELHGPKREEHLVVVLGVGPGLGFCIARVFAAQGYATAIMSRSKDRLDDWAKELDHMARQARGEQADSSAPLSLAFACDATSMESIKAAMSEVIKAFPKLKLGTAAYNASIRNRGDFLKQGEDHIKNAVAGSIYGGITFAQAVLRAMEEHGQGGNFIVTGATSSTRGREGFASFAAAKSGLRAMVESLAREYGKKGVHVAHVVVDGMVESEAAWQRFGFKPGQRFPDGSVLRPEEAAKSWLFLAQQQSSAWTKDLDLRPAREHF